VDLLKNLIDTVGLDQSFFYQLSLAVIFYFISKELFLRPYIGNFNKRQELTKGRLKSSRELEEKIKEKKALYEQKAKELHKKFQEVFNAVKQKAQEDCLKETSKIQSDQKQWIERERRNLKQTLNEEDMALEKELSVLVDLLVEKVKS